jgi:ABC-type nitrate/sulfonate/bicarbonate transport system substrate-binding protein
MRIRKIQFAAAGVALCASLCLFAVGPARAENMGVSYQPALYWSLPYFIASEKGWWKALDLEPNFSTFPSGAPQMAAAASKSWDVGGTGSAPAVLGASRFNIVTLGITNDESTGNAVLARKDDADAIKNNPQSLKGKQILLTTNSTGEYVAVACATKWGLDYKKDLQAVNLNQQDIISAFATGTGTLAGLWAPNIYTMEEKRGAVVICSGSDTGSIVPGTLIARRDFAEQNPQLVAKYLAVYLRAIKWMKEHREETIDLMDQFYRKSGVTLPRKYLAREIDTRPTFTLDEQLEILKRSGGPSKVDTWYTGLGKYLVSTGTLQVAPEPQSFIEPKYMEMVAKDAKLRVFADDKPM